MKTNLKDYKANATKTVKRLGTDKALLSAEIERLRAALMEISTMDLRYSGANNVAVSAISMARAALSVTNKNQR